jgi:hypothetical protein
MFGPMPKIHPHAEATYRILQRADSTYGIEVSVPDSSPTIVTSFGTEADAEAWIADHKRRVVEGNPAMRARRTLWAKPARQTT